MNKDITPKVWVGNLGAYNDGKLVGEWIDATDNLAETVSSMTAAWYAANPADGDEWFIADYDGFGAATPSTQWPDLEELEELAKALEETMEPEALLAYLGIQDVGHWEISELLKKFEGAYAGKWANKLEYTYQYVDDVGMLSGVGEHIAQYFDYEKYLQDLEITDIDFVWAKSPDYGVYAFRKYA